MANEYYIFLAMFFTGLAIRAGYEVLKKSGRIKPGSRLVFIIIFSAMALMWASWFGLCPLDPRKIFLPGIVRWFGYSLFLSGLILVVAATVQLRGLENIDHLVTNGLFSKLRHPMYTGFMLWIPGWALYHGALASLLPGCVLLLNILYWRRMEEKVLLQKYGEDYHVW